MRLPFLQIQHALNRVLGLSKEDIPLEHTKNITDLYSQEFVLSLIQFSALAFFILIILFSIIILTRRLYYNRRDQESVRLIDHYQSFLSEFVAGRHLNELMDGNRAQHTEIIALTQKDIQAPFRRRILLTEIKSLHRNIEGQDAHQLRALYLSYGFVEDVARRLDSNRWDTVIQSMDEIIQFRITSLFPAVFKMIHHSNEWVRQKAIQHRIVYDEHALAFLEDIDETMSDWDKHHILLALDRLDPSDLPDFKALQETCPHHSDFLTEAEHKYEQIQIECTYAD